jgi:predicted transcriptional regulator
VAGADECVAAATGLGSVLYTHTTVCDNVVCMQVDRLSVAIDPDLGQAVRQAAATSGVSVSRWMGEAARDRLRNQLLGAALDAWEAENGPFTEEELAEADQVFRAAEAIRRRAS